MKKCTTLLISDYGADDEAWRKAFSVHDPKADIRTWDGLWRPEEIDAILIDTTMTSRGGFAEFRKLRWVSYLGHAAGDVLSDQTLPAGVIVTHLKDQQLADSLKLSALQSVLSHQQRILDYRARRHRANGRASGPSSPQIFLLLCSAWVSSASRLPPCSRSMAFRSRHGAARTGPCSGSQAIRQQPSLTSSSQGPISCCPYCRKCPRHGNCSTPRSLSCSGKTAHSRTVQSTRTISFRRSRGGGYTPPILMSSRPSPCLGSVRFGLIRRSL